MSSCRSSFLYEVSENSLPNKMLYKCFVVIVDYLLIIQRSFCQSCRQLNDSYLEKRGIEMLPDFSDPYKGR